MTVPRTPTTCTVSLGRAARRGAMRRVAVAERDRAIVAFLDRYKDRTG